ncbi:hypothetical protein KOW79_020596 [Hemibagrus wyckioides]|uniref:Ig-like domain-containing protein n=1 Tax=Hemibagrus wyckioides TaxID=337641 RepID=A0A9D3N530_9TELE|nr:hypothetical protein KOW79_020596 [Hemibagrus wyckioides]
MLEHSSPQSNNILLSLWWQNTGLNVQPPLHPHAEMVPSNISKFATASSWVIQLTSSITVDIPQSVYELVRGDTAVLPCTFKPQKPDNSIITITWNAHPDSPDDPDIEILSYYYSANSLPTLDIMDDYQPSFIECGRS